MSPETASNRPTGPAFRRTLLLAILLAAAVAAAYFPVFTAGFVWDDFPALHHNPFLPRPDGLIPIWTTHGRIPNESHFWPFVYTMYWFEYRLWGLAATGYHIVNVLIHILNCLLLWRLLARIPLPGAWIAAMLFALHPAHVESVAWIHERKDVLSMFWYLAAFLFFVRFEEAASRRPARAPVLYAATLLFFAAGLLTKSVVVTLPAGMAVYIWWCRGRLRRSDAAALAPFLVVGILFILADMAMMRDVDAWKSGLSPAGRLLLAARAFCFYLRALVLPVGLTTVYPKWTIDPASPVQWLWPLAAVALPLGLFAARRRIGRAPAAAVLFFGITLAPMLGIMDFAFLRISWVADRFQYLAGAAPIALAGAGLARLLRPPRHARFRIAAVALLLLTLATLTFRYAQRYHNAVTLFRAAVERNPQSPFVHAALGAALGTQGQFTEAEKELRHALAAESDDIRALSNLGVILGRTNRTAEAVAVYRRALAAGARSPRILNDLAWFLATSPDPAIRDGAEAVRLAQWADRLIGGDNPAVLDTLAAALAETGRFDRALATARRASLLAGRASQTALQSQIATRARAYAARRAWRDPAPAP